MENTNEFDHKFSNLCPVSSAWHSCVAAHSIIHCYKQAQPQYNLRCLKATLIPMRQTDISIVPSFDHNMQVLNRDIVCDIEVL